MVYFDPIEGKSSNFEFKQNLQMRLRVFHDLPTEEPNRHISRFVTIVECMGPDMVHPQILNIKAFPFSLGVTALDCFEDYTFFYQGLNENEKRLLDSSARGSFIDLSPSVAEQLITNRAANELQYGSRTRSESILGV